MTAGQGDADRPDHADHGEAHWFNPVARFLGPAYLRYSFTRGTDQEVSALAELLPLHPGDRVLDVGCGPGRHALRLAEQGYQAVGIDLSAEFVTLARDEAERRGLGDRARFEVLDARDLAEHPIGHGGFDAAISLCQGAFGLTGGPGARSAPGRELDEAILAAMAGAVRPGGRLAVSAFSAYFQLRYLEDGDTFDAETGVNHEHTALRNTDGDETEAELWTTCYTPRELRLLARVVGLDVDAVHGVRPGRYRPDPPSIEAPELLLVASVPTGGPGPAPARREDVTPA